MNNFIGRLMKKKQKMEESFDKIETEMDRKSENSTGSFDDDQEINPNEGSSDLNDTSDPSNHKESVGHEESTIGFNATGASHQEKLENEVAELKDKYIRLYAEFDNFKRRTSKERSDLFKTANKEVLVSLLPVLDDLERAQKSFKEVKEIGPIKEGVELITNKFKNLMAGQGLTEIKSIGETFDTDLHEAITNVPAPTEKMKGKVIDEMEKGYRLNDKVIRFAKVIVGV